MVKIGSVFDPVKLSAECIKDNDFYSVWVIPNTTFRFIFCVLDKYDRYLVLQTFPCKSEAIYCFDWYSRNGGYFEKS